jgi:hypothetical protein
MHLSSPTETFEFTGIKEKDVSSTAKVPIACGGVWNAGFWEGVGGLPAWTGIGVSVKQNTECLAIGSGGLYNMKVMFWC